MKFTQLAALCALASTAVFAQAKPVWQDFSVTGLYGENYEVVDDQQTTLTVEYAAKVKYADVFFFMDRLRGGDDVKSTYFELSPRLSLSEVTGQKLAFGPVKDVLISTTWEGSDNADNFLYGVGFDLDIPYFQYASLNLYRANNEKVFGNKDDYQMTLTYGVPFKLGAEDFLVDGFLDWSTAEKDAQASELNWTTQWKWNAGKHISPDTRLYLGVEHSVWSNKFGLKNQDENNVSALVKYHF